MQCPAEEKECHPCWHNIPLTLYSLIPAILICFQRGLKLHFKNCGYPYIFRSISFPAYLDLYISHKSSSICPTLFLYFHHTNHSNCIVSWHSGLLSSLQDLASLTLARQHVRDQRCASSEIDWSLPRHFGNHTLSVICIWVVLMSQVLVHEFPVVVVFFFFFFFYGWGVLGYKRTWKEQTREVILERK